MSKMKLILTIIFGLLVAGLVVFRVFGDRIENIENIDWLYDNILPIAIALCFVFAVIFFKFTKKNVFLTIFLFVLLALAITLYFLKPEHLEYTINYKIGEEQKSVVLALADILFLAAQLALVVYTVLIFKGVGLKIISVGVRIAISVVACVVMKNYFEIELAQMLYIVSLANLLCTMVYLAFDYKNNWLTFVGVLLLTLAVCLMAFKTGQLADFASWENAFVDFLRTKEVEAWCFVAGTYVVALSSVWEKKADR